MKLWQPVQFIQAVHANLDFAGPKGGREYFDLVLNDVAGAFLSPAAESAVCDRLG